MRIETRRRAIGGAITFTSRLHPDNGVNETGASVGSRVGTEASALDVAPVTPLVSDVLDARAALVHNEVSREALARKHRSKSL